MHNSYFFYKCLVGRLSQLLPDSKLVSCFSQEKDELVLEFNNGIQSFFIRVIFSPELSIIVFPEKYARARNNSADIFQEAIMGQFTGIELIENERTFIISLDSGSRILFRMHGASGNIIFESPGQRDEFRKSVGSDLKTYSHDQLRKIDWTLDYFLQNHPIVEKAYFIFGKEIWKWLRYKGYDGMDLMGKYDLIREALSLLNEPAFYVGRNHGIPFFSLLPFEGATKLDTDPIHAINSFYQTLVREKAFHTLRQALMKRQEGKLRRMRGLLEKNDRRFQELSAGDHFREWADLIMAYLHVIRQGQESFRVERFISPGEHVEVRLKPELSPQKNAEVYYRKARNREEEFQRLKEQINQLSLSIEQSQQQLERIQEAVDIQTLRTIESQMPIEPEKQKQIKRAPFIEFEFMGFQILVGRSSSENDELTFQIASKDDLWFHVRDVAGSHVILRNKPGKTFPDSAIERAAALAAYYSKRKGESLCPVAMTRRKYVRKRKGDPPGAVVVEREQVRMVVPAP